MLQTSYELWASAFLENTNNIIEINALIRTSSSLNTLKNIMKEKINLTIDDFCKIFYNEELISTCKYYIYETYSSKYIKDFTKAIKNDCLEDFFSNLEKKEGYVEKTECTLENIKNFISKQSLKVYEYIIKEQIN